MRGLPYLCIVVALAGVAPSRDTSAALAQRGTTAQRGVGAGATLTVQITDRSGNPLAGTSVAVAGPVDRTGSTAQDGSVAFRSMRPGTYRLRFEREGYITLERELVMRADSSDVSAALSASPAVRTTAPPPAPAAEPVPAMKPPTRAIDPRVMSLTDYLERNLIRSEPQKVSLLACMDSGTARLLQVRDPLTNQNHADADELIYIVAGSGAVRIREQEHRLEAGFFAVVPRGAPHTIRREGRQPLFALTILSGAPCTDTTPPAR